jgi:flagellar basal body-associated protein FliL
MISTSFTLRRVCGGYQLDGQCIVIIIVATIVVLVTTTFGLFHYGTLQRVRRHGGSNETWEVEKSASLLRTDNVLLNGLEDSAVRFVRTP